MSVCILEYVVLARVYILYEGAARWEVKLFTDDCVMISFHVPHIILGSFLIQGVM